MGNGKNEHCAIKRSVSLMHQGTVCLCVWVALNVISGLFDSY